MNPWVVVGYCWLAAAVALVVLFGCCLAQDMRARRRRDREVERRQCAQLRAAAIARHPSTWGRSW